MELEVQLVDRELRDDVAVGLGARRRLPCPLLLLRLLLLLLRPAVRLARALGASGAWCSVGGERLGSVAMGSSFGGMSGSRSRTAISEVQLLYPKSSPFSPNMAHTQHPHSSSEPTSALFDLLGRRWALRILWEIRDAALTFQTLQARCDSMSTSVLTRRLGELQEARLVERDAAGRYGLTRQGAALLAGLDWIDEWTQQWAVALGEPRAPGSTPRSD